MAETAEVAIVGAGLAGCAAAIELGRKGVQSVLFEKGKPFKDKACGDAFMPSAITLLYELGLDDASFLRIGGSPFQKIDLFDNSKLIWSHQLRKISGWTLPRKYLDQELRELAKKTSKIYYQSKVIKLASDTDKFWRICYQENDCQKEMNASAVIIATGAENNLSRMFHIAGSPLPSASLSAYIHGTHFTSLLFQFTDLCKNGYAWIFPVNDGLANVGICAFDARVPALKRSAEKYLEKWKLSGTSVTWRGGKEPLWSANADHWDDKNGMVSCGDAAGLIDPLNGEGITAALYSGKLAATHVYSYLIDNLKDGNLTEYSISLKKFFTQRYGLTIQRNIWKNLCRL